MSQISRPAGESAKASAKARSSPAPQGDSTATSEGAESKAIRSTEQRQPESRVQSTKTLEPASSPQQTAIAIISRVATQNKQLAANLLAVTNMSTEQPLGLTAGHVAGLVQRDIPVLELDAKALLKLVKTIGNKEELLKLLATLDKLGKQLPQSNTVVQADARELQLELAKLIETVKRADNKAPRDAQDTPRSQHPLDKLMQTLLSRASNTTSEKLVEINTSKSVTIPGQEKLALSLQSELTLSKPIVLGAELAKAVVTAVQASSGLQASTPELHTTLDNLLRALVLRLQIQPSDAELAESESAVIDKFLRGLLQHSNSELQGQVGRLLHQILSQHGVTFSLPGDPNGAPNPVHNLIINATQQGSLLTLSVSETSLAQLQQRGNEAVIREVIVAVTQLVKLQLAELELMKPSDKNFELGQALEAVRAEISALIDTKGYDSKPLAPGELKDSLPKFDPSQLAKFESQLVAALLSAHQGDQLQVKTILRLTNFLALASYMLNLRSLLTDGSLPNSRVPGWQATSPQALLHSTMSIISQVTSQLKADPNNTVQLELSRYYNELANEVSEYARSSSKPSLAALERKVREGEKIVAESIGGKQQKLELPEGAVKFLEQLSQYNNNVLRLLPFSEQSGESNNLMLPFIFGSLVGLLEVRPPPTRYSQSQNKKKNREKKNKTELVEFAISLPSLGRVAFKGAILNQSIRIDLSPDRKETAALLRQRVHLLASSLATNNLGNRSVELLVSDA